MNNALAWRIAIRYFKGKRLRNAVPILSRISMGAIAVGSCAMIILLSVFNGFDFLVRDLYKAFYADVKISPAKGKFFAPQDSVYAAIGQIKGIKYTANVIEDIVFLQSDEDECVATIKGIDSTYFHVNDIKQYVTDGADSIRNSLNSSIGDSLATSTVGNTIMGSGLMEHLGLAPDNPFSTVIVYYPDATAAIQQSALPSYHSMKLRADGVFHIQDDFDGRYMLASLKDVQQLFNIGNQLSSIELRLEDVSESDRIKNKLQTILGAKYKVETRFEQNKTLYMVMSTEKWAMFAILTLVLLIASLNMIGALALLVMDKRKDVAILMTMGAEQKTVRNIFLLEGILWSWIGGGIGLVIGTLVCLGQQYFHFIELPGAFIIDAFPVYIKLSDFPVIITTLTLVGILAAWYPAKRSVRNWVPNLRSS